jgi:hypothetical protein
MPMLDWVVAGLLAGAAAGQNGPAAQPDLRAAIAQLGSFDDAARTHAAQVVRRAPAEQTAPLLEAAVSSASDEYVRYRALVLLTATDAARADRLARRLIRDRDDRVRTVVYQWFERHPTPEIRSQLLQALTSEQSEFVRPALTRALAASATDPQVQNALRPLVMRGEDVFRGSLIVALGDYRGSFALKEIAEVAHLDGPLQEDAVMALGRLGGPDAARELVALQKSGPANLQPAVSASLCLVGLDCDTRVADLASTLLATASGPGNQPLLRGVVHALAALAVAGHESGLTTLLDVAANSRQDAVRAPIALGVGLVALRNPTLLLHAIESRTDRGASVELVRDAFDMLAEDFDEERFASTVRAAFMQAPAGSPRRATADALITALEY